MAVYTGTSGKMYFSSEGPFAGGGEGDIYEITDDPALAAKIYKNERRSTEKERKLLAMTKIKPDMLDQYAWPVEVLYEEERFAGYLMPRIYNREKLRNIYVYDKRSGPWTLYVAIAKNLSAAVHNVHEIGQCIGDLNPENILVDPGTGLVTMVDTDSCHITDADGNVYRCEVGMPEFVAPELQGKHFPSEPLPTFTPETDLFSLSALIFSLLMNGAHPFACKTISGSSSKFQPIDNLVTGITAYFAESSNVNIDIPKYSPELSSLPLDIQSLFQRAFVGGHSRPKFRPKAEEWFHALDRLEKSVKSCEKNPAHLYYSYVKECPWCAVEEKMQIVHGAISFSDCGSILKEGAVSCGNCGAKIKDETPLYKLSENFQRQHVIIDEISCFFDVVYKYNFSVVDDPAGRRFYTVDNKSYFCTVLRENKGKIVGILFKKMLKTLSDFIDYCNDSFSHIKYKKLFQKTIQINGMKSEYFCILLYYSDGRQYLFRASFETIDHFYEFSIYLPEERKPEYQEIVENVIYSFDVDKNIKKEQPVFIAGENDFQKKHTTNGEFGCSFDIIYKNTFSLDGESPLQYYNVDIKSYICAIHRFKKGVKVGLIFPKRMKILSDYINWSKPSVGKVRNLIQKSVEINELKSEYYYYQCDLGVEDPYSIFGLSLYGEYHLFYTFFEKGDYFYNFKIIVPDDKKNEYQETIESVIYSFNIEKV